MARALLTDSVLNLGPPTDFISDNGKQVTSKSFLDVCRILKVQNAFTTTHQPQTNGQMERFNRTILSTLRAFIGDHPRDWDLETLQLPTRTNVNLKRRQLTGNLNWCCQNHQDRLLYKCNYPSHRQIVISKNNRMLGSPKRWKKQRVIYAQPRSGINATTTRGCERMMKNSRKEILSSCARRIIAIKNRDTNYLLLH